MGEWDELDEALNDEARGAAFDEADEVEADEDAVEEIDEADDLDEFDEVDEVPDAVRAELEAVAAAEDELHDALEDALTEAQRALAEQREATRAAVGRYREALLAAEPDLPPDLVAGETLEDVDASVSAARQTVARICERMSVTAAASGVAPSRGFPVGSPSRGTHTSRGLSSAEKIAAGLGERRA